MRGSQKGVNPEAPCRGGRRSHPGGRQGTPPESMHREKKDYTSESSLYLSYLAIQPAIEEPLCLQVINHPG